MPSSITRVVQQAGVTSLHWHALRLIRPQHTWPGLDLDRIVGVAAGFGTQGEAWLARLAASPWAAELIPTPLPPHWRGTTPDLPPDLSLASLALHGHAAVREAAANAASLARYARCVVATAADRHADPVPLADLRAHGIMVVIGAPDLPDDHLHHFPLRAAIAPRRGHFIGIDLADVMELFAAAGTGTLLCCPGLQQAAELMLRTGRHGLMALWHGGSSHMMELAHWLDGAAKPRLFTNSEGLDGAHGTVDLLMPNADTHPMDCCEACKTGAPAPT